MYDSKVTLNNQAGFSSLSFTIICYRVSLQIMLQGIVCVAQGFSVPFLIALLEMKLIFLKDTRKFINKKFINFTSTFETKFVSKQSKRVRETQTQKRRAF